MRKARRITLGRPCTDSRNAITAIAMPARIDKAARTVRAPVAEAFGAFATPAALETWLPPAGMTGRLHAFDFREGGGYRMRLTYEAPHRSPGKTDDDVDVVEVRFTRLDPPWRIEQAVTFASEDPAFCGEMRIAWTFESTRGGTRVRVQCENVPPGIGKADHEAGLRSTLDNLAAFVEGNPASPLGESNKNN